MIYTPAEPQPAEPIRFVLVEPDDDASHFYEHVSEVVWNVDGTLYIPEDDCLLTDRLDALHWMIRHWPIMRRVA